MFSLPSVGFSFPLLSAGGLFFSFGFSLGLGFGFWPEASSREKSLNAAIDSCTVILIRSGYGLSLQKAYIFLPKHHFCKKITGHKIQNLQEGITGFHRLGTALIIRVMSFQVLHPPEVPTLTSLTSVMLQLHFPAI